MRTLLGITTGLLWLTLIPLDGAAQYDPLQTRPAMNRMLAQLRILLPLAVEERFGGPADQERIHRALAALAAEAGLLDDHAKGFDAGGLDIAAQLERDARAALAHHQRGETEAAQYLVRQMVGNCVVCHSRLPSPHDAPMASAFLDAESLEGLSLLERADLQIATRRFGEALDTLEEALRSPELHPVRLIDPLVDYLTLCVRVTGNFERPVTPLQDFARRSDVWTQLSADAVAWAAFLPELASRAEDEGIQDARRLIEEGRGLVVYPSDRRALVHYLVASRILHRIVAQRRDTGPEVAEAHYLLGSVEARIGRGFWTSRAGFYLERAIRLAPGSDLSRSAFALLEEEILAGYTGSGGTHLPEDERQRLDELRELSRAQPLRARRGDQ